MARTFREKPRTHTLPLLFNFVIQHIEFKDISIDDIIRISDYYETDRYPEPKYFIPSKEEIGESLKIAENIYNSISKHKINVNSNSFKILLFKEKIKVGENLTKNQKLIIKYILEKNQFRQKNYRVK
jgi:hypothetical protein